MFAPGTSRLFALILMTLASPGCGGGNKNCTPNDHSVCELGTVYWVNSCNQRGDKIADCECGCNLDSTNCKEPCCAPDCTGKCCGSDGCSGVCSDLCSTTGQTCNLGTCSCEGICAPNCQNKACGPDGCGADCGTCSPGLTCNDGACVSCAQTCGDSCCLAGDVCRLSCQDPLGEPCNLFASGVQCAAEAPCAYIRDATGRVTQTSCPDSGNPCTKAGDCQGICRLDCQPSRSNPCDVNSSTARCAEFTECIWIRDAGGNATQSVSSGYCSSMSCPFLFLWTGRGYQYLTDLAGSVLSYGNEAIRPQYYDGGIYALGDWAGSGGLYRMKVRETIHESDFFDSVGLVLVDLPVGYDVLSLWSFTSQIGYAAPKDLVSIRRPHAPVSAHDARGNDVLARVRERDEIPLDVTSTQTSMLEVDFGPIQHPEHAKLILTAWSHFQDLRRLQNPPYVAGTTIETRDASGAWQVRLVAGRNPGDRRTWAVDIAGIPSREDTRLRITMAHTPWSLDVLDQVLLDDSPPVRFRTTRVVPRRAELGFAGSTNYSYSSLGRPIDSDDANNPAMPDAVLFGDYTRYGDVVALLAKTDDRFVIMAHGDELTIEFDEPARPPNTIRRVFLDADVFYTIKYSIYGLCTDSIDPLPFHGMSAYPYDLEQWPYRDDADYQLYRSTYNTRRIATEAGRSD